MPKSYRFANNLRKRRLETGLTQVELAILVGVAKSTIAFWEQGRWLPIEEHQKKLSEIFGKKE